jgi:hypothetical protein
MFVIIVIYIFGAPTLFQIYRHPFVDSMEGRYLFPLLAVALSALVLVSGSNARPFPLTLRFLSLAIVFLVVLTDGQSFFLRPFVDYHWNLQARIYAPAGREWCRLLINSPGYIMRVPCAKSLQNPMTIGQRHDVAVPLRAGGVLAQSFSTNSPLIAVAIFTPTWQTTDSGFTLVLRKGRNPQGEIVAEHVYVHVPDNSRPFLTLSRPASPGIYTVEMVRPVGKIGWWADTVSREQHFDAIVDTHGWLGEFMLQYYVE